MPVDIDMPELSLISATVDLATADGRTFDAYLVRPAAGPAPGLLMLPEMYGINEPLREMAASFARKNFAVLVPNVFWRCDAPGALAYDGEERDIAWARLRGFDFATVGLDLKTAADWLKASAFCTGKVGAIGFCMGGRLAVIAAIHAKVDVAISLYALGLTHHLADAGKMSCPIQLHYGLNDRHIPVSEIEAVDAAMKGHPNINLFTYPNAGHSFFNPVRPTYDAEAAAVAAERIDAALATLTTLTTLT
jgi:carboxymethylenebutenolidase